MKELDFLPEWYRADRQLKCRRRRYCVLFGVVTAMIVVWSFIVGHSVSGLRAETQQVEAVIAANSQSIQAVHEMEQEIKQLSRQTDILEALTPRTAVTAVLGELSARVNDQIIFSRVLLVQEPVIEKESKAPAAISPIVRVGASKPNTPSPMPEGPQQMRLVLTGIAANGAQVARLIDRLETSNYFMTVSPGFSRAKKVNDKDVTEFEITCSIADYEVKR